MNAEEEWEELTRFGSSEFPPGWVRKMTDVAYWKPAIERLFAEHDLPIHGDLRAGKEGSHAVFLTDDTVVKIYAAPWLLWFERERETLQALEAAPEAKAPRLLASGNATDGDRNHPYLILERLPGEPLSQHWETLSQEERCHIAIQVGQMVRALHSMPVDRLHAFTKQPEHWVRRMRTRAQRSNAFLDEYQLPDALLSEIQPYLNANLEAITPDFQPCLLSADLHADHILIEKHSDEWQVTGQIDFGDAEVGPVEYEWFALCLDAFRGDQDVVRAFFTSYGWTLPMPPETRRRLKLSMLLFRFPNIGHCAQIAGKPLDTNLDALLDSFWPQ